MPPIGKCGTWNAPQPARRNATDAHTAGGTVTSGISGHACKCYMHVFSTISAYMAGAATELQSAPTPTRSPHLQGCQMTLRERVNLVHAHGITAVVISTLNLAAAALRLVGACRQRRMDAGGRPVTVRGKAREEVRMPCK
jgi:hypothetical protein